MKLGTYGFAGPTESPVLAFKRAMRQLASGVSVITHASGAHITGVTATSVTSLTAEPPTLIVCVHRSASLYARLGKGDLFGVNVLGAQHAEIAERFESHADLEGDDRFQEGDWRTAPDGVPQLHDALAVFICEAEDVIERHAQAILLGRVKLARPRAEGGALLNWRGTYDRIGWSEEELSRAVGLRPHAPRQEVGG